MSVGVVAYCDSIAKALVAAGVRAVTDPGRITVPCVFIAPSEAEFTTLDGEHARTAFVMHLIAPGKGGMADMAALSSLAAKVIKANVAPVVTVRLTALQVGDQELPCFDMEWVEQVSWTQGIT
jgi:hypothetical protein